LAIVFDVFFVVALRITSFVVRLGGLADLTGFAGDACGGSSDFTVRERRLRTGAATFVTFALVPVFVAAFLGGMIAYV